MCNWSSKLTKRLKQTSLEDSLAGRLFSYQVKVLARPESVVQSMQSYFHLAAAWMAIVPPSHRNSLKLATIIVEWSEWKEKLRSTGLKRFCKTNDRCPSAHGASCEKVCQNKWWSASGRLSRHEKVNKNKLSISSDKGDLSRLVTCKM